MKTKKTLISDLRRATHSSSFVLLFSKTSIFGFTVLISKKNSPLFLKVNGITNIYAIQEIR